MSELMLDALFGVDGTEPPPLRADPSGRDASELPPLMLPAIPGPGVTREAIAARLGEDPIWLVDQDPGPSPEQQPAAAPRAVQHHAPHLPSEHVLAANALAANAVSAHVTAPLPPHAAPQLGGPSAALGDPSAAVAPDHSRPRLSAPVPPGKLAPPKSRTAFFRSPLAVASRTPVLLSDLRRRVGRPGAGLPVQLGSSGGAGAFFFISLIIFLVLVYGIIAGIVESVIKLFQ